jgi:uncharacterized protein (TIGR00661 family)
MRILYGITANGNGHLARSSRIAQLLRERGHELCLVISGEPGKAIMDEKDIQPFLRFDGFSFANAGGRVSPLATAFAARPLRFLKNMLRDIPKAPYDVVITDFEPVVAWYARLRRLRSVGLCHMYSFLYPGVPAPASRWYENLAFRWLAPADIMLGIHWQPYHRNIIPPFVTPSGEEEAEADLALVYLPWEDPADYLPALQAVQGWRFIVYGAREGVQGHVELKRQSRDGFQRDLNRCSAVLANAGFALAGEALSKGKRLILKPYAGQVEQEHNALEAERLQLASRIGPVQPDTLTSLLAEPARRSLRFPDMTPRFIDWIESGAPAIDKRWHEKFWEPA